MANRISNCPPPAEKLYAFSHASSLETAIERRQEMNNQTMSLFQEVTVRGDVCVRASIRAIAIQERVRLIDFARSVQTCPGRLGASTFSRAATRDTPKVSPLCSGLGPYWPQEKSKDSGHVSLLWFCTNVIEE